MRKENLKYKELVGKEVLGIKFPNNYSGFAYIDGGMDKYVGKSAKIVKYHEDNDYSAFMLRFEDGVQWGYPCDLIYEQHLLSTKTEDDLFTDVFKTLKNV